MLPTRNFFAATVHEWFSCKLMFGKVFNRLRWISSSGGRNCLLGLGKTDRICKKNDGGVASFFIIAFANLSLCILWPWTTAGLMVACITFKIEPLKGQLRKMVFWPYYCIQDKGEEFKFLFEFWRTLASFSVFGECAKIFQLLSRTL